MIKRWASLTLTTLGYSQIYILDDSQKEAYGGFVGSNPTRSIFINLVNYDIKLSPFLAVVVQELLTA
jgi:hypothetical protein